MNKKFFFLILALNFGNFYGQDPEKLNHDPEKFALAKIEIAQKTLENMDKQWTLSQMATLVTVASITGMVLSLGIGKDNQNAQNTIITACSGLAVTGFSTMAWYSGSPAGSAQERLILVKTIQDTQPRYRAI